MITVAQRKGRDGHMPLRVSKDEYEEIPVSRVVRNTQYYIRHCLIFLILKRWPWAEIEKAEGRVTTAAVSHQKHGFSEALSAQLRAALQGPIGMCRGPSGTKRGFIASGSVYWPEMLRKHWVHHPSFYLLWGKGDIHHVDTELHVEHTHPSSKVVQPRGGRRLHPTHELCDGAVVATSSSQDTRACGYLSKRGTSGKIIPIIQVQWNEVLRHHSMLWKVLPYEERPQFCLGMAAVINQCWQPNAPVAPQSLSQDGTELYDLKTSEHT